MSKYQDCMYTHQTWVKEYLQLVLCFVFWLFALGFFFFFKLFEVPRYSGCSCASIYFSCGLYQTQLMEIQYAATCSV